MNDSEKDIPEIGDPLAEECGYSSPELIYCLKPRYDEIHVNTAVPHYHQFILLE